MRCGSETDRGNPCHNNTREGELGGSGGIGGRILAYALGPQVADGHGGMAPDKLAARFPRRV